MRGDLLFLGRLQLLQFRIGKYGDATIGRVGYDLVNDLRHLLFQFVDKLLRVVFLVFDVAQFLFPDTC